VIIHKRKKELKDESYAAIVKRLISRIYKELKKTQHPKNQHPSEEIGT
jgi:hypothetical protein